MRPKAISGAIPAADITGAKIFCLGMAGGTASVAQPVEDEIIEVVAPAAGGPAKKLKLKQVF